VERTSKSVLRDRPRSCRIALRRLICRRMKGLLKGGPHSGRALAGLGTATFCTDLPTVGKGTATFRTDLPAVGKGTATFCTDLPTVGKGAATFCTDLPTVGKGTATFRTNLPAVGKGAATFCTGLPTVGEGAATFCIPPPLQGIVQGASGGLSAPPQVEQVKILQRLLTGFPLVWH